MYPGNKRCFGKLAEDHDLSLAPAYEPEGGAGDTSGLWTVLPEEHEDGACFSTNLSLPPDIRLLLFSQGRDVLCSRETSDRARLGVVVSKLVAGGGVGGSRVIY